MIFNDLSFQLRLPQTGVNIPLDEGFLTHCECTDGCQDKEKCACWHQTIQSTAASNQEAKISPNAGYEFRRLKEGVSTGIYECNKFCKCSKTCINRVAQNPLRLPLQVRLLTIWTDLCLSTFDNLLHEWGKWVITVWFRGVERYYYLTKIQRNIFY